MVEKLAQRIAILREEMDLDQDTFGKLLGVVASTVSGYETGKSRPNYEVLLQIARRCNVQTDWLLGRTDERMHFEEIDERVRRFIREQESKGRTIEEIEQALAAWDAYRRFAADSQSRG